jgi:hypothetical protein
VFRPETEVAFLITPLVIIPKRVASGFSRLLIKPAARENTSCRFNPHHCSAGTAVLDRRRALEVGRDPMINVALARDVVVGDTIMRQMDDPVSSRDVLAALRN